MTVSSTTNKATYSGNGTTTTFTVPFYFLAAADLQVILRSSAGVETVQTLTSQYTVTGAGVASGGTVTMVTAPASGTTLTVLRNVSPTQETDLLPNDRLPAESLETALDKLTMLVQQLDEESGRSLKYPATDTAVSAQLPTATARAGKYLGFDGSGLPTVSSSSPTPYMATDVSFTASGTGATPRSVSSKLREHVSVTDFGADPAGGSDCTFALQAAIAAGAASIYFPKGSYRVSANADITLVNDVTLWGEGVIQYVGAGLAEVLWRFLCNGYSLTVNGLTFDGATAAAGGILIRNTTAMTTSLPDATVQECTFRNFKMLAVCDKSVGASVAGSFNTVYVLNNRVQNITRAAGTGVVSVSGTSGINITTVNLGGGALRWPRQCIHTGNSYDNISGDDAAGSAANYDYDGFVFAVPSPASFSNSDSSQNVFTPAELISSGNSYRNCRGRALKVQGIPTITNEKIVRDAGYCLTTGSVEIDMQFGVGTVKNCTFMYYDYLVGATVTSPLSGGLALLSGYQGSSLGEATTGLVIDGITVFNEIKSGIANSTIDLILYATIGHATAMDRHLVSLSNVIVNRNPVTAILQSDFNAGQYGLISLENVTVPSLAQAAVLIASTNTDRRINAVNVVNLAGVKNSANAVPFFRQAGTFADGTWQGVMSGYNNLGFLFSYRNSSSELQQTPSLVDAALVGKERQGAFSVQTVQLANDETKAFDTRGIVTNRGLIGISVSWGTGSQGILSCSDDQVYVIAARATNDFEASTTGSNLDTPNKVNLWYTGGKLNVKNRLGSSRFVTIWFLG